MTDSSARPSRTSLLPAIDPKKFDVFEQSFLEARDAVKLARLYLSYAAQESDPKLSAERLRRGVGALAQLAESQEQVSWLLHELVRLDPEDDDAFDAVRTYYESTEKHRELIRLLEDVLQRSGPLATERARELGQELYELYRDKVDDKVHAARQLAVLLSSDDPDPAWLEHAEELLATRGLVMHLGGPLALAYQRLGKSSQELSVLTRELEVARGARLTEVQSRLAALRQEFLDDPEGAMELLEPLVSRDPSHDEARGRYLALCEALERLPDAARRLKRALGTLTDPEAQVRVGLDLGRTLLRIGEAEQAKAELIACLTPGVATSSTLAAAELLVESFPELEASERMLCSLAIAANSSDTIERHAAARRLLEMSSSEGLELSNTSKKTAWLALLDAPEAGGLLDELEALCGRTNDKAGLARVFERRSELASDPEAAAGFAYKAADLFEAAAGDAELALARWKQYHDRFQRRADGASRVANLLAATTSAEEHCDFLRRAAELLDGADAASFWARAGELELTELGRPESAFRSFERALEIWPSEPRALAALTGVMARGEQRLDAAAILEGVARRTSNDALLADVLGVRSELASDAQARQAVDIELFELLRDRHPDPKRALELAARVLKQVALHDRAALLPWLERVRSLETPAELWPQKAEALAAALADQDIDGPELFTLARDAGLALTQAGNFDAASAVYEKGLMYDPSAADLALGLDALRAKQGIAGAQRVAYLELSLIDVEENVESWCRVMAAIASIHQKELGDSEAAARAYHDILEKAPDHRQAHRALVEIYQATDPAALAAELERAISVFSGAERLHAEFLLAMSRADSGDAARAVDLCHKLLDAGSLTEDQLEAIADLADRQSSPSLLRRVHERRIEVAPDDAARARELERLGTLLNDRLGEASAAAEAFRLAARAVAPIDAEREYAKALFERALELGPSDHDAAAEFVGFCVETGDWDRISLGVSPMIASDPARAASFLIELGERAHDGPAAARYAAVVDDALEVETLGAPLRRGLMAAKARALATDPEQRLLASRAFRALIEAFGQREDEASFEQFIKQRPLDDDRTDDQRWLFERRAGSADDPVEVLLDWARVEEEEFNDLAAAIAVYDRLLEAHSGESRALEHAARLKLQCGAYEGALDALRRLEAVVPAARKPGVTLRIASLTIRELGRPEEGYAVLTALLAAHPENQLALTLAVEGLASPVERVLAARTLAAVLEKLEEQEREPVLERMLAALSGVEELRDERRGWYDQLIALKRGAEALKLASAAAAELPDGLELWERAEQLASDLELPEPVAQAYERALARDLPQDLVASLGQRMLAFHEQWFGDSAELLPALLNLLKQTPHARWALGRAVLALNAQGRFDEVFALFDAAITYAPEGEERISLLDEAALTAKDLANDPERAIQYLEQLVELKPEDARAQSTLERLYKRCGHTRKLIELLTKRLADLTGPDLIAMLDQIACRWLELDHADEALACVRQMLDLDPESDRACQIMERVLGTEDFADAAVVVSSELAETRERAAELLKATYQRMGRLSEVVRIAETELEFLDDKARRGQVLREIVAAKLGDLDDRLGAFTSLSKLVQLEPASKEPRRQLRALAEELTEPRRYAEILVRAAENSPVECELFLEAALVYAEKLTDRARETELFERVLQLAADDATVLVAARALDRLLSETEDVDHHCEVLERLAGVETEPAARRDVLVRAAKLASDALGDWERAAKNWREVLSFAAEDHEALDGLVRVLLGAKQWVDVIAVLEARAALLTGERARADHLLIAKTYAERLGDNARAIERWQLVRESFGPDDESFHVLARLLEAEARWEALGELLSGEAAGADGERRALLLVQLATVRRDHLGDLPGALDAFVSAREWRDAVSIIESADTPERAAELTDSLRVVAIERWYAGDELAEDAAYWAIKSRAQQLLDLTDLDASSKSGRRKQGSPERRAFQLLNEAVSLPFSVSRRRSLQRSAALVSADALHEPEGALEIFRRMFEEDVTDTAAVKSVTKYSELLEQAGRHVDRARLWERIARALVRTGDEEGARSYFEHAGLLWEQLEEVPLAIAAHQRAAELNSVPSLEALTRLHSGLGDRYAALETLERVCELSQGEALEKCALAVFERCIELGERYRARIRLEAAVQRLGESLPLRARLADLYREEEAHHSLATLLVSEVPLRTDPEERLALLREAATLYQDELGNPAAAIPLLAQAVALAPTDQELKLALASAQSRAGLHESAMLALRELIEGYGVRRPKARARVHQTLAQALARAGKEAEALAELELAAEISATDASLLFEYGSAALAAHDLERAEQTFRASLLLLHRPAPDATLRVSRADVYLSLSEVAAAKGERLATKDFLESAFEIALEGPDEASQLEACLKARGKDELLKRALESRLSRSASDVDKIAALAELAGVYARLDDKEARVATVSNHADRLQSAIGTSEKYAASWRELARVYAWLGDEAKEIDALEAYLVALPVPEYRARHADAAYRVAEARIAERIAADKALALLQRAVALDPAPERRDALLERALAAYPRDAGFARAAVRAARMSGRENQLAGALTHLATLPEATLEEGRAAVRQCAAVGNGSLLERTTSALLQRVDLDGEMRFYLQEQLAQHHQTAGRYAEAFDLLLALADGVDGGERHALLQRAVALFEQGLSDDRRAALVYRKLLAERPDDRSVWEPLFATYLRLGDHAELKEIIEQTLPKVRGGDRGALRLAQAKLLLTDDSDVDAAVATLEKALDEDPGQREAAELLAETLERLGRLDELVSVFEAQLAAARTMNDKSAVMALTLRVGVLLERAERPKAAVRTYEALLGEFPEQLQALRALFALADQVPISEPVATLRRLLALESPERVGPVALKLYEVMSSQGESRGALEVLAAAFEKAPGDEPLRRRLVEAYAQTYDVEAAAEVLSRAVEARPKDAELLFEAVDAWVAAGQAERALALLDKRLAERPADAVLHFKRAELLRALDRDDQALAALERAHDESGAYGDELVRALEVLSQKKGRPESDVLILRLADLLEKGGQDGAARQQLRTLLLDSPDNADALSRLARLAEKQDDPDDAIHAYRGLLRLEQGDGLVRVAFKAIDVAEKHGRLSDVLDDMERVRERLPDHERLRDRIRAVYEKCGETKRLADVLADDAARSDAPETKALLLAQAARLIIDDDPARAEQYLEQAEREHPSFDSGVLLARLRALRGQRDEAIAELEQLALSADVRKPAVRVAAFWELAQLYLREDQICEAFDALLQAQKLERRNGEVALTLGMLALDLDDEKTAGRALRSVTAMKDRTGASLAAQGARPSERSKAYFLLGNMARKKGDTSAARRLAHKAVVEDPDNHDAQLLLEVLQ